MKLQLYILRELCVDFTFAVGGMFVLALPAIAVAAVSKLSGVDIKAVLYFLPLLMSGLVPYVLPLGYLLALVVTYGRLAADNEWTAIRMSGIHPLKMLTPALILALFLGAFTLWLMSEELPRVRKRQVHYQYAALKDKFTHLSPGCTELHYGRFELIAGFREGDDFLQAVIYIPPMKGEEARTFVAERIRFRFSEHEMLVYMHNACIMFGPYDTRVGDPVFRLDLDEMYSEKEGSYTSLRYRPSTELEAMLARGEFEADKIAIAVFEIHQRRAVSSTYLMFLLLGVPTGLLLRRGTQLGALSVAVGYALLYYILSMRLSQQLATSDLLSPLVGAWTVNGTGMLIGAVLLWRALRQ